MPLPSRILPGVLALVAAIVAGIMPLAPASAQAPEPRIALVIGNAAYKAGALATPANDAGLVAETLGQSGFDVVGARDLDQDSIRKAFRDFLDKAQAAGPNAIAFVYLSGYGVQYAGENYYVPVEATMPRDTSVPIEAVRISDFTRALSATPLKARVVVLDLARANPFVQQGQPLAGGLAIVDPEPGTLYAMNAAPGTVGPNEPGPYGAYAQALVEMMHEGLAVNDVFTQTRLRVNETTQGLEVPWDASNLTTPFTFFQRAPNAGPPPALSAEARAAAARPIRDYPAEQAYGIAVERDTLRAYEEFLAAYPHHPLAKRVRALLAARREAITWEQTVRANTPDAYWTYMRRYPKGPHVADARRRLERLSAALQPPPSFRVYDYEDLPPPPPDEVEIIDDRPYVYFDEDDYPPPPPPPAYLIERPRQEFVELPPPPPPQRPGFLPIPVPIPMPWSHGFGRDHDHDRDRAQQQGQAQQFVPLPQGVKPPQVGTPPKFTGGPRVGQPGQGRPQPGQAQPPVQAVPVQPGQAVPATRVPAAPAAPAQPAAPAPVPATPAHPAAPAPVPATPVRPATPFAVPSTRAPAAQPAQPEPGHALPQPGHPGPQPGATPQVQPRFGTPASPVPAVPAHPAPAIPAHPAPVVPAHPAPVVPAHPAPAVPARPAPAAPALRAPSGPSPAERAHQLQLQRQQMQERAAPVQARPQPPHPAPVQARPQPPHPAPVQARPQPPHPAPVQARPQPPHPAPVQARPQPPHPAPVQARPQPPHPAPVQAHPAPACGHPGQPPCPH